MFFIFVFFSLSFFYLCRMRQKICINFYLLCLVSYVKIGLITSVYLVFYGLFHLLQYHQLIYLLFLRFKIKYHPEESVKRKEEQLGALKVKTIY